MQCAKIVVEMLALVHFAGFTEYLAHFFRKAFGLEPGQAEQFFNLFNTHFGQKDGMQAIQTYY